MICTDNLMLRLLRLVQWVKYVLSAAWPKVAVAVNPFHPDRPFSISHDPPLPGSQEVTMVCERLSMEDLLADCIAVRSHAVLMEMKESLRSPPWEGHGKDGSCTMSFSVQKCGLVISVPSLPPTLL